MSVLRSIATGVLGLVLTAACGAGILSVLGASPLEAYRWIAAGAFGTPERISYVLTAWTPLLLCAAGLLLTFAAGVWNIGIEGQVIFGAGFATGLLRALEPGVPAWAGGVLAGLAALLGGGVWGSHAAYIRGIPVTRGLLWAFAGCGGLAGLAGFVLVIGAYSRHQLFPLISGGYGFLAILVVLLAGSNALAGILISAFFAAVSTGSLQLPLQMHLDSAVSGILEGTLVLLALLMRGVQARLVPGGR